MNILIDGSSQIWHHQHLWHLLCVGYVLVFVQSKGTVWVLIDWVRRDIAQKHNVRQYRLYLLLPAEHSYLPQELSGAHLAL